MYIKISPENKAGTLKFLKEKYEEMRPDNVFSYRFFSDALNLNYAHEQQLSRIDLYGPGNRCRHDGRTGTGCSGNRTADEGNRYPVRTVRIPTALSVCFAGNI